MALNSSNSNAGSTEPKIGAGALLNFNTENKSNGNFSGGDINFDTSKLSISNPFDTNEPQQPTFNTDDVFKPTLSGNLDIDLPKTNNNNSSSNNTTYSNNSTEPTMTVDEVYGKSSNQPVVEKQGDYSASSNEKSNVETSTFGKQDEVSVTPTSVTENKGLVGNAAIQSVEGLDFQQKDKASVDVLDSKKKRDEVEAKDKANSMRNQLKAGIDKAAQEEGSEDFRIGDRDEDLAAAKAKADEAEKVYKDLQAQADKKKAEKDAAFDNLNKANIDFLKALRSLPTDIDSDLVKISDETFTLSNGNDVAAELTYVGKDPDIIAAYDARNEAAKNLAQADITYVNKKSEYSSYAADLEYSKYKAEQASADYSSMIKEKSKEAPAETPVEKEAPTSNAEEAINLAKDAIKNSENATPEQKAQAEEVITNLEDSRKVLEEAAAKARSGNPADMVAYQEALETYNKNLKEAQKIGNRWTQTDFNKEFTRAVIDAKDFKVTLSDGTEMEFSDFMSEEATKSPQYAKAMYEAKAQTYEDKAANATGISKVYYGAKAKIERKKAEWSQTVLGSKFTFADDKVRNQFYQFVDTNMRATYATDNNILNDKTGKYSDDDKAKASTEINQAKALKTAAAVLKASTGTLSGIGDDVNDGEFGTTDVKKLTEDQRMMASIKMFTQAVLGLGISPAANKAYQNYYYLNRGDGSVFENDLDNDGFTWVEEYGNNAAAGLILSAGELGVGVVLLLNPASFSNGTDLIIDAVTNASNALYGVRNSVEETQKMTQDILSYFKEAENIAESSGNEEAVQEITNAITQIENFELKADEVGNLDNWLEGSGSNTATNEKFNQSLTYDEWLKLIEADPTMREFAKSLTEKKKDKNAQKDNADTGVNS